MKVITVLSGGMDSTALMYYIKSLGHEQSAISFYYGQKHSRELIAARDLSGELGIGWVEFDLSDYAKVAHSALTSKEVGVPEGHYAEENMRATVVPNRNMTMLSIATAWAISKGAEVVATGVHAGDHAIYPDCRPEFIIHMETTLRVANEGFIHPNFQILAPWLMMTKADIARRGDKLQVPWDRTWSCYKGGTFHCGKCGTCVERKEAFLLAGILDPTEYEQI